MYFQRDYVLRMIEMLGEMMRRIKAIAREADAYGELEEVAQKACGLPMSMLETGAPDMLRELMDEPQRFLAAELLLIDVEVKARTRTDEALLPLRTQALALYSSLKEPDYLFPATSRVSGLLAQALDQLPVEILLSTASALERGSQYATAEDALFAAADADASVHPFITAFYDRLTLLDDETLLEGGLSREEIEEGRTALNERLSR